MKEEGLEIIEVIESKMDIEAAHKALINIEDNGIISWEEIKSKLRSCPSDESSQLLKKIKRTV